MVGGTRKVTPKITRDKLQHEAELIPRRRQQQSVPHPGLREALLAPTAAPALPDVVRSSSAIVP